MYSTLMKTFLIGFILSNAFKAQCQPIQFDTAFAIHNSLSVLHETSDSALVCVSYSFNFLDGNPATLNILKFNKENQLVARTNFSLFNKNFKINEIIEYSVGYKFFGSIENANDMTNSVWIIETDFDLNITFEKLVSIQEIKFSYYTLDTLSGHVYISGSSVDETGLPRIAYLIELDEDYNLIRYAYDFLPFPFTYIGDIHVNSAQELYLYGQAGRVFLVDSLFNVITIIDEQADGDIDRLDQQGSMHISENGEIILTGRYRTSPISMSEALLGILKYDSKYEKVNTQIFGRQDTADYAAAFESIAKNTDDGFYVAATSNVTAILASDEPSWLLLTKFDEDLNLIWEKCLGGDAYYLLFGVEASYDGGCYLYGQKNKFNESDTVEMFFIKVDRDGQFSSVDYTQSITSNVKIYPNPASNKVFIEGDTNGDLLTVFDTQGKAVHSTYLTGNLEEISLPYLSAGQYVFNIRENGNIRSNFTQRIMLTGE